MCQKDKWPDLVTHALVQGKSVNKSGLRKEPVFVPTPLRKLVTTMTEEKYYVTKQGLQKIEKEYQALLEFKKKKATGEEVPSIWHSEEVNPDYLTFQEDMSLLEAKLGELEVILKNIEIITAPRGKERHQVGLGATITVDLGGEVDVFTIVGTLEADPLQKRISNESPLGNGLLGAKVGDTVKVVTSLVNHDCKILKIVYR